MLVIALNFALIAMIVTGILVIGFVAGEVVRWHVKPAWEAAPKVLLRRAVWTGIGFSAIGMILLALFIGMGGDSDNQDVGDSVVAVVTVWICSIVSWQFYVMGLSHLMKDGIWANRMTIAKAMFPALIGTMIFITWILTR